MPPRAVEPIPAATSAGEHAHAGMAREMATAGVTAWAEARVSAERNVSARRNVCIAVLLGLGRRVHEPPSEDMPWLLNGPFSRFRQRDGGASAQRDPDRL